VPPGRIELPSQAPQARILSVKLRGPIDYHSITLISFQAKVCCGKMSFMNYYSTEAFILKKELSEEKDNVYHFFTKDFGKINLLAKGTRDILAKLSGHLETPALAEINFSLSHNPRLITALEKEPFLQIKNQAKALSAAFQIEELVDSLTILNQKDPELFKLIFDTLYFLNNNLTRSPQIIDFSLLYFEAHFLQILGYTPFLDGCVVCGQRDVHHFSLQRRGLVCSLHHIKNDLPVTLKQKKYLKFLFELPLINFSSLASIKEILTEKKFLESFLIQFTLRVKSDIM
jgi:DNA repair protein RecO